MRRNWLATMAVAGCLIPATAHAQGFDVEQATRAYLNLLQGPARAKSDAYFEGGYWLVLWNAVVGALGYWLLLATGASARLRDWAEARTRRRWLATTLYALGFTLATTILFLPWAIYTGFIREAQYDLMSQSFGAWLGDQGKGLVIGLIVTPLAFLSIFAAIRRFPRSWWIWGTGILWSFFMIGALVAPVFIMPLFNTYAEMPAGPLRDRIVAMARAHDIPSEHIYVADASRQSKRISANVSGFGPTIRITLNDNLLNRTTPDEVAAVMGHEMGHYVLSHVWRNALMFALVLLAIFFILWRVTPALIARHPRWRLRGVSDIAAAPALLIVVTLLGVVATPVLNTVIRSAEAQADAFGLDAARRPDAFALVAIRLSEYRKLEPGPIEEFLFFDHPSGESRIRRAMQWKKDNVPGATMEKPVMPTP